MQNIFIFFWGGVLIRSFEFRLKMQLFTFNCIHNNQNTKKVLHVMEMQTCNSNDCMGSVMMMCIQFKIYMYFKNDAGKKNLQVPPIAKLSVLVVSYTGTLTTFSRIRFV